MSQQPLPDVVENIIMSLAQEKYPLPDRKDFLSSRQDVYKHRHTFLEGATAALTDPSIYEKAGLVKKNYSIEDLFNDSINTVNIVKEAHKRIEELKSQLTTANARIGELEELITDFKTRCELKDQRIKELEQKLNNQK